MTFKDYFSGHAGVYAAGRPSYPNELFSLIEQVVSKRDIAWDCATGNGQTALALAQIFKQVIGTDGSSAQIESAFQLENIEYKVAVAESAPFANHSVDLVTVSQALHWFNLDAFFEEVDRVLLPGGVLAVWSYGIHNVEPKVDSIVDELYRNTLEGYWTPERIMVEQGYADVKFPYEEISTPELNLEVDWSLAQLVAYLESWSAVQKYQADKNRNPVDDVASELAELWPIGVTKRVCWPLTVFIRKKPI